MDDSLFEDTSQTTPPKRSRRPPTNLKGYTPEEKLHHHRERKRISQQKLRLKKNPETNVQQPHSQFTRSPRQSRKGETKEQYLERKRLATAKSRAKARAINMDEEAMKRNNSGTPNASASPNAVFASPLAQLILSPAGQALTPSQIADALDKDSDRMLIARENDETRKIIKEVTSNAKDMVGVHRGGLP